MENLALNSETIEKIKMEAKKYDDALADISTEFAKVRLERAKELLEDSQELLAIKSYKSANNRAFYAMEKSIKTLLATQEMDAATHNGGLKQFNYVFIHKGDGSFRVEDYQKIAKAEQIRNVSDYDDFYIAGMDEYLSS